MAASVHTAPEDADGEGPRPFDRTSLEASLAEALRATQPPPSRPPTAFPAAPSLPPPPAAPSLLPPPAAPSLLPPPAALSPTPAAFAPAPPSSPAPPEAADHRGPAEAPAAIPSGLRLLPPPPPAPAVAPPEVRAETAPATVAVLPWRPEDDDILPTRRGRGRRRHR